MTEFNMPSLGADMDAGTLVEWSKKPGDILKKGDIIAVVETQKGAIEVEVFEPGTIDRLLIEPGTRVPVGTPLAIILAPGEAAPAAAPKPAAAPPKPAVAAAPVASAAPAVPRPSPAPTPVLAPASGGPRASPAARKLAAERGIDLATVTGTGPGGAITLSDVEHAGARPATPQAKAAPPEPVISEGGPAPEAASSAPAVAEAAARKGGFDAAEMRKAIAAAMSRSKREIPHYYLSQEIDITDSLDWLARFNAARQPPERVLPAALMLKAVALALKVYPEFNGFYTPEGFRPSKVIHLGVAIAIRGGGLVAPAIHDADVKTLDEVMAALRDLVARTRAGRLKSSEMFDPTITVTSLGDRGVDTMYAVITPPQVAIVGFGTPAPRPWVRDGKVEARSVVTATVAADHRVSDGHRGALFLLEIEQNLKQAEKL